MNPLWVYQMLLQQGVPQAQAMQMAFTMSGSLGTGSPSGASVGGAPGASGGGSGGVGDALMQLLMGYEGTQAINTEKQPWNLQMDAAKTGMNPALLSQRIAALTKPLSTGLVKSVTRATTPGIAEAGLATSPGMSQQMIA